MQKQFKNGDTVKIRIEFDAGIITDLDSVTEKQLADIIWDDEVFSLYIKSICVGRLHQDTPVDDHDTELLLNKRTVTIRPATQRKRNRKHHAD